MLDVAEKFFWPCDEGKGWEACKEYCHPNATFKTDADTLVYLDRLEDYVEWMKDAHSMFANAKFEIKSFQKYVLYWIITEFITKSYFVKLSKS